MAKTLTEEQLDKYNELRLECRDYLLEVVDGSVDAENPAQITHPNASCLIAKALALLTEIDLVLEGGE